MKDERVDVVDTDSNILYSVTKLEAHQKGLLHKTVIAEVTDAKERRILVQQAGHKQDAGQYVSPVGGHIRSGETDEEALKREALEEAGLKDFKYKFVGKVLYRRTVLGRDENHYFVLYEITLNGPITLGEESVHYQAFTDDELRKELHKNPKKFGAAFYVILKQFYPHLLS